MEHAGRKHLLGHVGRGDDRILRRQLDEGVCFEYLPMALSVAATPSGRGFADPPPAPKTASAKGRDAVTQAEETEPTEPTVTDVPEPDQDPGEEQAEEEAHEAETAADEPIEVPEPQETQQAEWEKRFTYAEKLFKTYVGKITDKWAEDALTLVPFNIDSGAPPGFIDTRNAGHVDEDTKAAAMEFLGFPREQDYEADPAAQQCATCKGKTKTKTGSLDPTYATRPCPTCKAFGYTIEGRAPSDLATQTNGNVTVTPLATEPLATGDVDAWNQPRILPNGVPNPNYGRTPDHWVHVEPWGDTRGLTAQSVGG